MKSTRLRALPFALGMLLVASLTGCGIGGTTTTSTEYAEAPMGTGADAPMGMDAEVSMEESRVDTSPQVIRTASAYLEVTSVDEAASHIKQATVDVGGVIDSENVSRGDDWTMASFTVRIPEAELDGFLDGLSGIGDVTNLDVNAQDVTLEVVDLEARIQTLEDSIARLRELQQQTDSVTDLVAVESELAARQSELESLTARRDYLANQVAMSTVYLSLSERQSGPAITPDFLGGLQRGWDALLTIGAGLITAVGFIAPTAIVVGLVVLVVIWLVRRRQRAKKGK